MANGHGGARRNSGGARPGAGRKKKLTTIIREKAIEEAGDDAKYALGLFVTSLKDVKLPLDVRLDCGKQVMDRVWGRSVQRREHSGPDGGPIAVDYVDRLAQQLARQSAALAAGASDSDPQQ